MTPKATCTEADLKTAQKLLGCFGGAPTYIERQIAQGLADERAKVEGEVERLRAENTRLADGMASIVADLTTRGDKLIGIHAACFGCRRSTPPGDVMARDLLHWPSCPVPKLLALLLASDSPAHPHPPGSAEHRESAKGET